jgi:hypothetical protein
MSCTRLQSKREVPKIVRAAPPPEIEHLRLEAAHELVAFVDDSHHDAVSRVGNSREINAETNAPNPVGLGRRPGSYVVEIDHCAHRAG